MYEPPRLHLTFDAINNIGDRNAEHGQNHNRHEQFSGSECVAIENHHVAQSGKSGEHFGNDNPDQCAAETQPSTGDEKGNRSVENDPPKNLPPSQPNARAVSMNSAGTCVTPICALMITGKIETSAVRKTFASNPRPSQMMTSGMSVTVGIAENPLT